MNKNLNYYITIYFNDYLKNIKGVSNNTILSYRDAIVSLLEYLHKKYKLNINNIPLDYIDEEKIINYLSYLENEKANSILTRNQRLAAIHSFFKYIQKKELFYFGLYSQILSIPFKKAPQNTISYFSVNEIEILINTPNTKTKYSFRDYTLLLLLYETAARAFEISNLKRKNIIINKDHSYIILNGKGNKDRNVPITNDLKNILLKYFNSFNIENDNYVFFNKNGKQITTKGIEYILSKYINKAKIKYPDKFKQHYSNHSMRHSRAMHLLEAGVNLIYIRDLLGHVSIKTTEIYAKVNPMIKEKQILENSKKIDANCKYSDKEKNNLLDFLKKL